MHTLRVALTVSGTHLLTETWIVFVSVTALHTLRVPVFVSVFQVAELMPERRRARLTCLCAVAGEMVLDGEALVKVPTKAEADPLAVRMERSRI